MTQLESSGRENQHTLSIANQHTLPFPLRALAYCLRQPTYTLKHTHPHTHTPRGHPRFIPLHREGSPPFCFFVCVCMYARARAAAWLFTARGFAAAAAAATATAAAVVFVLRGEFVLPASPAAFRRPFA